MKNYLLVLTLFISFISFAQSGNVFGIKAGTNYSQFTPDFKVAGNMVIDYQGKFGYYFGGFYTYDLSDTFSLQPELLFVNQGTKIINGEMSLRDSSGFITFGSIESVLHEYSIAMPIIFRFKLNENIFLEAGPHVSYTINRKEIIKKDPFGFYEEGEESTNSPFVISFDKFDAGINAGIGFNLAQKLGLNLRYNYGLIQRDNNYHTSQISLGIEFKL